MKFTETQRRAIESATESAAIVAGAGSGKTSVLVERIARLLAQKQVPLDRLCCITFTEKAAAELKARLTMRLGPDWLLPLGQAQISTFHAFAARCLREQAARIGYDAAFTVLDETAAALALARATRETLLAFLEDRDAEVTQLVDRYTFAAVCDTVESLVEQRWAMQPLPEEAPLPPPIPAEAAIIQTLQRIGAAAEATYTTAKRGVGAFDFADLEIETGRLLHADSEVRERYQQQFSALLVDEAQDVNDLQAELLRCLYHPPHNTLTIVGDPKQSIYRFRGANVAAFASLAAHIARTGGVTITLQENFRSAPAICAFVNNVAATMPSYQPLLPTREERPDPEVVALAIDGDTSMTIDGRRDVEAAAIVEWITARRTRGCSWKGHAILFQSKSDMDRYTAALRARGIPTHCHSGGGFLDRPEVRDLLAALQTVHGMMEQTPHNTALLRCLRSPLIGLTDDECYRCCFPDLTEASPAPRPLATAALTHPIAGTRLRDWVDCARDAGVAALITHIIRSTDYETHCYATDPSGQSLANCEKLFWLAEREALPLADFLRYCDELSRRAARVPDQPVAARMEDVVQLMTVHAAKGLEFDTVILADCVRQIRPDTDKWLMLPGHGIACKVADPDDPFGALASTDRWEALYAIEKQAHAEEQQRLLYVAMTRARDCLVVPIHHGYTRDAGTWHVTLKSCVDGATDRSTAVIARNGSDEAIPRRPSVAQEIASPRPDTVGGDRNDIVLHTPFSRTTFTVSELDTYDQCPLRYRLQYIDRIPSTLTVAPAPAPTPTRLPGHLLGEIVHAAIHQLAMNCHNDPRAMLATLFRRRGLRATVADLGHAVRLIAAYRERAHRHAYTAQYSEWPFCLALAQARIRGTIDHIGATSSGWIVTDYKTDRIDRPEECDRLTAGYELQLMIYVMAAQQGLNAPIKRTRLHFLEVDRVVEAHVTPTRCAAATERLTQAIARIGASDFAIGAGEPPCARCPYHHNHCCWEDRLRPE